MTYSDSSQTKARVAVIGAGAIGGLFAAAAHDAGHDVTLCVRTPIPGLEVTNRGEPRDIPVRIATTPEGLEPADWVLVATKAQDTASAAPWLERLAGPAATVAIAQNGIGHEERVRPLAPRSALLPALVYIAVERVAPGRVVRHSGNTVMVPEGKAGAAFARMLEGSGLTIRLSKEFHTEAWRKLLTNVAANPITALSLRRMDVFHTPDVDALSRALLHEAVAVGRADGADLGGADVEFVMDMYLKTDPGSGTSMLYDRLAGRSLEHEHLAGAVVAAASRLGMAAPLNTAILTLLRALDQGIQARG